MPGLGKSATRGLATLVALIVALVASLLIGGQLNTAGADSAVGSADRGVVAKNGNGKMTSTIFGKAADGSKVTGNFTPLKFVKKGGVSSVKGVIEGVVTHPNGTKERFTALRTMTVKKINGQTLDARSASSMGASSMAASSMAACDILHLVLGPLDLDLLGLQIHLDRVVLDIVAVAGAGNLLGNLLCAVAGLLDGGPLAGLLAQLTDLLNQILGALNLGI
jgi:hypothetical protein